MRCRHRQQAFHRPLRRPHWSHHRIRGARLLQVSDLRGSRGHPDRIPEGS